MVGLEPVVEAVGGGSMRGRGRGGTRREREAERRERREEIKD